MQLNAKATDGAIEDDCWLNVVLDETDASEHLQQDCLTKKAIKTADLTEHFSNEKGMKL